MENKEFAFKGMVVNGFLMTFINLVVTILAFVGIVLSIITLDSSNAIMAAGSWAAVCCCS